MGKFKKIAFIFPGQGAQYPGMAKDFFDQFQIAKETFEESDDILKRDLSSIVFKGPELTLTETRNSQTGIFVASMAIYRVLSEQFPELRPQITAGLSLGEYTAATIARTIDFPHSLPLVQQRGALMNEACEKTEGTMAVVLGLTAEAVEAMVKELALPEHLWAANFNCPGQVVISGTKHGIALGTEAAKKYGAKRVLPLQVHGAFHSGLMRSAEERLEGWIAAAPISKGEIPLVMNVTGKAAGSEEEIRNNLVKQVTSPVRWEQGIRTMVDQGVDLYLEIGPGKSLAGFNKRIEVNAPTLSIEKVDDLKLLESLLG